MRRPTILLVLLFLGAAAVAHAGPGLAPPDVVLGAGTTFGANSTPKGGGATLTLAALWPIEERFRVGLQGYADDIGTSYMQLADPNDGTPLGPAADVHRWTWGAAWRVEADAWRSGPWTAGGSGGWGWWRIEDDRRGRTITAGSAVGLRLGAQVRRAFSRGRSVGLEVNYHRLARDHSAAWQRVDRYASAALQYRWAGRDLHD